MGLPDPAATGVAAAVTGEVEEAALGVARIAGLRAAIWSASC